MFYSLTRQLESLGNDSFHIPRTVCKIDISEGHNGDEGNHENSLDTCDKTGIN